MWLTLALAAPVTEGPVVEGLVAELARAETLAFTDAPPVYHVRYHLADLDQYELNASFGSVMREDRSPYHGLGIELRIGSPEFDNTGFGGWENGFSRTRLAVEMDPLDVRQSAWMLTDSAYKQAVEQYARKQSQFRPTEDHPGDYSLGEKVTVDEGTYPLAEMDAVRAMALAATDVFQPGGAFLTHGSAHVGAEAGHVWMLDTLGSRVRRRTREVSVRLVVSGRTEGGVLLTDSRLHSVSAPGDLPTPAEIVAESTEMFDRMMARRTSERLKDEYVGPVLFEGPASADLFRYLLVPQLEGTPTEVPYDSFFGDLGERRASVRLGRRVLPEDWTVSDDPRADLTHPSGFELDWEGQVAERVELVDDGIVRDVLMSRVPRKDATPNGHARSWLGDRAKGRASQLVVMPRTSKPQRALRKRALKMAASYGLDHVMVVRRLQEPAVLGMHASGVMRMMDESSPGLPPPVEVVKLYADGSEVVLHGAEFESSERFLLRDIAMAGQMRDWTFLAPFDGDYSYVGPTGGLPTRIMAPDVLIREVELTPAISDSRDTPVLRP